MAIGLQASSNHDGVSIGVYSGDGQVSEVSRELLRPLPGEFYFLTLGVTGGKRNNDFYFTLI